MLGGPLRPAGRFLLNYLGPGPKNVVPSDLTFPAILPGAIKSHPPLWGSGAGMGRLPAGLPPVGRRPFHTVSFRLSPSGARRSSPGKSLSHSHLDVPGDEAQVNRYLTAIWTCPVKRRCARPPFPASPPEYLLLNQFDRNLPCSNKTCALAKPWAGSLHIALARMRGHPQAWPPHSWVGPVTSPRHPFRGS